MGIYLNPGSDKFMIAQRSEIYVDKSEMLAYLNSVIQTEERFVCVSRPRRFGKSMAANMIAAYYDRTVDAASLFHGLNISRMPCFQAHCSKYDVIQLNMQDFLSKKPDMEGLLALLQKSILWDLLEEYPNYRYFDETDLERTMSDIYSKTKRPFVIVIDEWDCIFRGYKERRDWQEKYLDFLRAWLKDKSYIGLAYMTGILPIKKYGTHSALNMFSEFSMTNAGPLASCAGFTESEVRNLCHEHRMDFEECKAWYDGYRFEEIGSVYNPRSVVQSMRFRKYDTYWNQTETFEALKIYIDMNYDGLREAVIALMANEQMPVDTGNFSNDMTTFHGMDDVLTLLVHLGYLGYDFSTGKVFIPNHEIMKEYVSATKTGGWEEIAHAIKKSESLLQSTLEMDVEAVAKGIEEAHFETSHLQYNDENALSYTLSLAYYAARQKYLMFRELPTGKGYADLVLLPRPKHVSLPALVLELKWDRDAKTAFQQIKDRCYVKALENYTGKILAIGISYDKNTKEHECSIEEYEKL